MGRTLIKVLIFATVAVLFELMEMYISKRGGPGFRIRISPNFLLD